MILLSVLVICALLLWKLPLENSEKTIAEALIALVLLALFFVYRRYKKASPQIIINEVGIFEKGYKQFVNWEFIKEAYPFEVMSASNTVERYIMIRTTEDFKLANKKVDAFVTVLCETFGGEKFRLNMDDMEDLNGLELIDFINIMAQADPKQRRTLITERLQSQSAQA